MTKLTPAQVKALRLLRGDKVEHEQIRHLTRVALLRKYAVKQHGGGMYEITPTGLSLLAQHDRAEREQAERLERASRPVPAQIGEPSAARPLVLDTDMGNGCDCDQDGCKVCFPEPLQVGRGDNGKGAVPQAWIDQLVTLLDAGARFKRDRVAGWILDGGPFAMHLDRLQPAVDEAIRRGIAEALPATPGGGVVRLALTDAFRERRAAERGVKVDAVVRYGKRRVEVARIEQGMARCFPVDTMDNAPAQWVELESLEPVTD